MPYTYVKKNTASSDLSDTSRLEESSTTTATIQRTWSRNDVYVYQWATESNVPNLENWTGGTWTWRIRAAQNATGGTFTLQSVTIERISSDGSTIRASVSATPNVNIAAAGVYSNTISWNDGSQNPATRYAADRVRVKFQVKMTGTSSATNYIGTNLTTGNDEITTPLAAATLYYGTIDSEPSVNVGADSIAATVTRVYTANINESPSVSVSEELDPTFNLTKNISETPVSVSDAVDDTESYIKPISETEVSVSDSIDDTEYYIKPITNEDSISVSDSLEGNKIPAAPTAKLFDVHFVEFPEDITDSLYVPPTTQVTPVSTTKTHPYDILEQVSTTQTHKYDVISVATTTKTHIFSVIEQISKPTTHKFDLLEQLILSKTHKFDLVSKLTVLKTHVFSVLASIVQTSTHLYSILNSIQVTKTHKYDVSSALTQVSTTKTHKFDIESALTHITKTQTHPYDVIAKVTSLKTHVFSTLTQVFTTKTHLFSTLQQAITAKTHLFSVISSIVAAKTHLFSVIEQIVKTSTHKYDLSGRITTTKTHLFSLIQKLVTTKTHIYTLLDRITPDATKTHKFNILTLVAKTRTHKFNIIGRITTTKTHKYGLGGRVLTTKTHRFEVGLGAVLQELGGSTQAFVRFQDRIRIIDIIADLNNLAIANVEIVIARPPANIATATVAIEEYSSKLLTASVHKPRHRIASRLIIPQIIEAIEHKAKCDYIAIKVLPLAEIPTIQARSKTLILQEQPRLHLTSQTQIKEDERTKIRIASSTMLQQTQETIIGSRAQLEIPAFPRPILAPEIMSRQKMMTLKTLINLLSSDILF